MANFSHQVSNRDDGLSVLELAGELDLASGDSMVQAIESLVPAFTTASWRIVVDMRRLEFVDSSGLRALMRAKQTVDSHGGTISLVRGSDVVHRVFELTGLHERFDFVDGPDSTSSPTRDR